MIGDDQGDEIPDSELELLEEEVRQMKQSRQAGFDADRFGGDANREIQVQVQRMTRNERPRA